jgi:hypothetical protein
VVRAQMAATAPQATVDSNVSEQKPAVNAAEALRARVEKLAAERNREETQIINNDPAAQAPADVRAPTLASPTLSTETRSTVQPAAPENSLERLLGKDSPLLDIFGPAPWMPEGRGRVTVGSQIGEQGFNWYKRTDPLQRNPIERATLPSGYYSGENLPRYVILRLESIIVLWSLSMESEAMHLYIAGLSDADAQHPRWFHPHELSASYTRRFMTELEKFRQTTAA